MAHASLVRPSAFQLAVILACSAFISAKLLLCAIPKPPAHHSQREGIARRATIASLSDGGLAVHFARRKTRESVTWTMNAGFMTASGLGWDPGWNPSWERWGP